MQIEATARKAALGRLSQPNTPTMRARTNSNGGGIPRLSFTDDKDAPAKVDIASLPEDVEY